MLDGLDGEPGDREEMRSEWLEEDSVAAGQWAGLGRCVVRALLRRRWHAYCLPTEQERADRRQRPILAHHLGILRAT